MSKYFKFRSNPLEEIDPKPGVYVADEFGNLWLSDITGTKALIANTILIDNVKLETAFENPKVALNGYWANMECELRKADHGINFK